jgi:hypothetical protein
MPKPARACGDKAPLPGGTKAPICAYHLQPEQLLKERMHPFQTAALYSCRTLLAMAAISGLGACTLPTNVAIKKLDSLRAEQTTCLVKNAQQMDDRTSDPNAIARDIAIACSEATERLVTHAITRPNPEERRAFQEEAELRAAGYVKLARSGSL